MTDTEIAKAKAHFEYGIKADIFSEPVLSYAETVIEAFDLIPRQTAEIKKLREVKAEFTLLKYKYNKTLNQLESYQSIAKAEAIREFAERLKKEFTTGAAVMRISVLNIIDDLVKEMAGEAE